MSPVKLSIMLGFLLVPTAAVAAETAAETFCSKLEGALSECLNEAINMGGRCPQAENDAMLEYSRAMRGAASDNEKKDVDNVYGLWINVANHADPNSIDPASDPYQDRWRKMTQDFLQACQRVKRPA